jgi:hypothetical protein
VYGNGCRHSAAAPGRLSPTIAATYPLDHVADARSTKAGPGKTVITLV